MFILPHRKVFGVDGASRNQVLPVGGDGDLGEEILGGGLEVLLPDGLRFLSAEGYSEGYGYRIEQ
ncbi:hypothetical protein [Chryseobacterium koreense]|uniref:hypothetical protein n=1 Tax=Chryseobacterium koreense TaxID=232216 RepID=UPI0026EF0348|nr:hypothetical protein [Chryseobacterium koreense]